MRDNDSEGFEPEPPKYGVYHRQQVVLVTDHFQQEPPPSPPPAYATLNRSVDSVRKEIVGVFGNLAVRCRVSRLSWILTVDKCVEYM